MNDAFGTIPQWMITPGTTIPATRLHMSRQNALWMLDQKDTSHSSQGHEYLNGVIALNEEPDALERHYLLLDQQMREYDERHQNMGVAV